MVFFSDLYKYWTNHSQTMSPLRQVAASLRQIVRPTLCIIHVYILGMTLRRANLQNYDTNFEVAIRKKY